MTGHPAVTLQILPFSAGTHQAMGGPFTVLRFTELHLDDVVYIEQLNSALYLGKRADISYYGHIMDQLRQQAEPPGKTAAILGSILART
jgi:hypothetical protein